MGSQDSQALECHDGSGAGDAREPFGFGLLGRPLAGRPAGGVSVGTH
jgi:hypothetical protein